MIFEQSKKTEVKPVRSMGWFKGILNFIVVGVVGATLYFTNGVGQTEVPQPVAIKVVGSSPLQAEVDTALASSTLEDKETFYKVYQGLADYCKNVDKVRDNKQILDMMDEVYITYNIQGSKSEPLTKVLDTILVNAGLNKNAAFAPVREKAGSCFQELADCVKNSIEKTEVK